MISAMLSDKRSRLLRWMAIWLVTGLAIDWIVVELPPILAAYRDNRIDLSAAISDFRFPQHLEFVPWYVALSALFGLSSFLIRTRGCLLVWLVLTFLCEALVLAPIVAYDPRTDPRTSAFRVDGDAYVGAIMGAVWAPFLMGLIAIALWAVALFLRLLVRRCRSRMLL
jgi:hypothetical protein